ncbi:MAG: type II secretion system F family protein [Methanocalculus sp.]|uniref:type II secretion system F family protein n=1 Tax=Methanocalculus sp. TaxID=2004547 RepID=UPI00271C917A|nr:type II secretion system F family protein [Methanocalculus sp.]MDO9539904.1 type II secretion system F family protein [Methanocalculus sp.]
MIPFYKRVRNYARRDPVRFQLVRNSIISARLGITVERLFFFAMMGGIGVGFLIALLFFFLVGIVEPIIVSQSAYEFTRQNILYIPFVGDLPFEDLVFRLVVSIIVFFIAAYIAFRVILVFPGVIKSSRATRINLTLHNSVAYMYAMRRGGAELIEIFRSLSENSHVYGEVALEFRQVVRDCDLFAHDIVSALRELQTTTPSAKMKDFIQDLLSVIESGGDMAAFLQARVVLYQDEARFEQKQFLNTLSLVAEGYVTLFVAGPLFLIIVMVVMGLMGPGALIQLNIVIYALIPIGTAIFIVFIDMLSSQPEGVERYTYMQELREFPDIIIREVPQKEEKGLIAGLKRYDRNTRIREFISDPLHYFVILPHRTFYFAVPLALLYLIFWYLQIPNYGDTELYITILDDYVIAMFLLIFGPYSIAQLIWSRRISEIEGSLPDFLTRLAGINEVGLTIAKALSILVRTNLGLLSYEIKKIKRDLDWGANVEDALVRFEERLSTPSISRTVTLITRASAMSGEIGQVLTIAASDAEMSETLKRERSGEMFLYTAVVYLSFFVFIFVVMIIGTQFLPIIELTGSDTSSVGAGFSTLGSISALTYGRLFYHAVIIQAICSGLLAGLMGESSLAAGVKHSCIMVLVGFLVFAIV